MYQLEKKSYKPKLNDIDNRITSGKPFIVNVYNSNPKSEGFVDSL